MSQQDLTALAQEVRHASILLANTDVEVRRQILRAMANELLTHQDAILQANEEDISLAQTEHVNKQLVARLRLTPAKIQNLADGIIQLANHDDPINAVLETTVISEGLQLEQKTVPLGVILIIFESRPEALPQIAALTLFSGNGCILKGGTEAQKSNTLLHALIQKAIVSVMSQNNLSISSNILSLVHGRDAVSQLLALHQYISLVIPRGSNALVTHIQNNTKIPVMGHSEGVCHVYVDNVNQHQDRVDKILLDSKCDYPSACNAMEVAVFHKDTLQHHDSVGTRALLALQHAEVKLYATEQAAPILQLVNNELSSSSQEQIKFEPCEDIHTEYGDLGLTVHVVDNITEAIDFINGNSSSHTEVIITDDKQHAEQFANYIDSASVFINASSRFADGNRFGLGCEVGISTSKLHARGPVGLKGLTTTKYIMKSDTEHQVTSVADSSKTLTSGHIVGEFSSKDRVYIHKKL